MFSTLFNTNPEELSGTAMDTPNCEVPEVGSAASSESSSTEDSKDPQTVTRSVSEVQLKFLKEFAPQTHILRHIPEQAQKGLNKFDIRLTCLSVLPEFMAIGSSIGMLYLYNRRRHTMQKLKCTDASNAITCISLVRSVDFMLAVGCQSGLCAVYRIPVDPRATMEQYKIDQVHRNAVTCLCWSQNAMKVFSGDTRGLVACTHIDYELHVSKSEEVVVEDYPIVQLDYHSQVLLVSTTHRAVLCHLSRNSLIALGQHPRKSLGSFGAIFAPDAEGQKIVYASRPGMRLWLGNAKGTVTETMLLRDALPLCTPLSPLLALPRATNQDLQECQFGPLLLHEPQLLLTWSSEALFLIDPLARAFAAVCTGMTNIHGVASSGNEIFVLMGKRHLVRLAPYPEVIPEQDEDDGLLPNMKSLRESLASPFSEIGALIKEHNRPISQTPIVQLFKSKNHSSSVLQWFKDKTPRHTIINEIRADSSMEASTTSEAGNITGSHSEVTPRNGNTHHAGLSVELQDLAIDEDEAIVFSARQRTRHKKPSFHASSPLLTSTSDDHQRDWAQATPVPTYDQVIAAQECLPSTIDERSLVHPPPPYNGPEDAKVLQILSCFEKSQQSDLEHHSSSQDSDSPTSAAVPTETPLLCAANADIDSSVECDDATAQTKIPDSDREKNDILLEKERCSSFPEDDIYTRHRHTSEVSVSPVPVIVDEEDSPSYGCQWMRVRSPGPVMSLAVCNGYLCCVDAREVMYYSKQWGREFTWKKAARPATRVALSPSGESLWVLYKDKLYAAKSPMKDKPSADTWVQVAEDVSSFAVTERAAWYIASNTTIFMCPDTSSPDNVLFTSVGCFCRAQSVTCYQDHVWVLTDQGSLLTRLNVSSTNPMGTGWADLNLPSKASPVCITLGHNSIGWLIDTDGNVWFKPYLKDGRNRISGWSIKWWQLDLNEFLFQGAPPLAKVQKNLTSLLTNASNMVLGRMKWLLAAGSHGVWFCQIMATHFHSCKRDITGYSWEKADVDHLLPEARKWTHLEAGGTFHDKGVVWGLHSGGRLAVIFPDGKCKNIATPAALRGLSASPECLWALACDGQLLVRLGQSVYCSQGNGWAGLDIKQLAGVHLVHVSCNHEVAWACDSHGRVYVRLGLPMPSPPQTLPQAWLPVDVLDNQDTAPHMTAVHVGPQSYMVWAVDSKKRVFVREGIFPELQIGTGWLEVGGVQAKGLCVSASAVWALGVSGDVFRRFNIGPTNYVGDYWKKVPGTLASISADGLLRRLKS
ncbi:tectonin beta-propeller repeat-containing protein 2-like isoform X2 [Ornithodoros turicata]|uniref:tectonin beta-propeller repeat-containing protein 2-like isoform X2 n=1 Tax=Ornithodoros turicata TaxID=34597 RepID=UPI003139973D